MARSGYWTLCLVWFALPSWAEDLCKSGQFYKIYNKASRLNLGIAAGSQEAGATAIQWRNDGASNQFVTCELTDNGYVVFYFEHSGQVLNVSGGSVSDGAPLIQWPRAFTTNEQWKITRQPDGYYEIAARHSDKVLGIAAGSTTQGASVVQWRRDGTDNQRWFLSPTPLANVEPSVQFQAMTKGFWQIKAAHSQKVLGVAAGRLDRGAPLVQWRSDGTANQLWRLIPTSPPSYCKNPETRYNHVQQISTHNAYDIDSIKPSLWNQAEAGVRSFEFDIHKGKTFPGIGNYPHSEWGVYHTTDWGHGGEHCSLLSLCLSQLREWHDSHPFHEVITVWLQIDDWETGGHKPVDLDNNRLARDLPGMIFRPQDILAKCPNTRTLTDAINRCGWPKLEELRGKFIVVLMGSNDNEEDYLDDVNQYQGDASVGNNGYHGNKLNFVGPDITDCGPLNESRWRNAIFFNINIDEAFAASCVRDRHKVSRIFGEFGSINDESDWQKAINNHTHHVATDHVTQRMFNPRLVDQCGDPMRPMVP